MNTSFDLDFPRAYGEPPVSALFKAGPEDFFVEEQLGFEPAGSGEHLYLFIEKRNINTHQVAEQLARSAGVGVCDIGYAGLKDRRAVTRQWFSVYLPKQRELHWQAGENVTILRSAHHHKKLRRGNHQANFFRICLKQLKGDLESLEDRLKQVRQQGVPNYFGEQRFGNDASNLQQVDNFLDRVQRTRLGSKQQAFQDRLRVSAMRSWLFNQVLAERVHHGSWHKRLEGEPEAESSGPLWGRGRLRSSGTLLVQEEERLAPYRRWCDFLEHCGLQQERRQLILKPLNFHWRLREDQLWLDFELPAGTYATAVLREIARFIPGEMEEHGIVAPDHEAA